jgi:hypothetical protein
MFRFDLLQLFDHPLSFRFFIPSAIVTFGGHARAEQSIRVRHRSSAAAESAEGELLLSWDIDQLRPLFSQIDDEVDNLRTRDEDRARRTELAAVVIAVAVMSSVDPAVRFTQRSATGTGHDYYLNETRDEMIEVAGRWEGGLDDLFEEKRRQSDRSPRLRKRWVSVTILTVHPRNRTEGLHA